MRGNGTVMKMGTGMGMIIKKDLITALNIKPGNVIDFDMGNPNPDFIKEKKQGLNFGKKLGH